MGLDEPLGEVREDDLSDFGPAGWLRGWLVPGDSVGGAYTMRISRLCRLGRGRRRRIRIRIRAREKDALFFFGPLTWGRHGPKGDAALLYTPAHLLVLSLAAALSVLPGAGAGANVKSSQVLVLPCHPTR